MLKNSHSLKSSKNLLAFSAGGDSTSLFFLLLEQNIPFDIAIVDYALREQSKEEITYAQSLAKRYKLKCFVCKAPKIEKNFEAEARAIRYDFFESLMKQYGYENLLTGHHLGDRLEWMLMQLCRGAGALELAGMQGIEARANYMLIRPLLHLSKEELLAYLHKKDIKYFEDESNSDESYKRNEFRHNYAQPLLSKYKKGIRKSFEYLDKDRETLVKEVLLKQCNALYYFKSTQSRRSDIFHIDRYFKSIGKVLSSKERKLLELENSVVISRKYILSFWKEYILITPFLSNVVMKKEFKEQMRKLKIPPKIRAYLSTDAEAVALLSLLLE